MSRQGLGPTQVAELCPAELCPAELCPASCSGIRKIINPFNRGGFAAPQDEPHPGTPA